MYDFDAMRKRLEKEWERLDASGTGRDRQREIEKELAKLNREEAKWKKLRATAESVAENLLEAAQIKKVGEVEGEENVWRYQIKVPGGKLDYESDGSSFWLLDVNVLPEFRRKGVATKLITELYSQAAKVNGPDRTVILGVFTDSGEKMKGMVKRVASQFRRKVKTIDDF